MANIILPPNMPIELEIDYWKDKLKGLNPLDLNTDYPKSNVQNTTKTSIEFSIGEEIIKQLNLLSERHNVSLFVALLTAYKILLYRYSNHEDICVGNAVLCTADDEKGETFVNTVILRSEINGSNHFEELLQRVNSLVNDAYEHLNVPFGKIADLLIKDQDLTLNDVFRAVFIMQDESDGPGSLLTSHTSAADLIFILKEKDDDLQGVIESNADLYKEETILHFIDHHRV